MKSKLTYWILNYVHSQFLQEKLNVAVLFYFEEENTLVIKYPKKFKRLNDLYSDFSEWQLRASLKAIEEKVNRINLTNGSLFNATLSHDVLLSNVLINDATVLQFSKPNTTIYDIRNRSIVIDKYYKLYFSEYKSDFSKRVKHDEEYILKTFKTRLFDKNSNVQHYLKKDTQIKSSKTTVKFEYEWHNGVANLIKPISFDLEEESSINHKAILFHGQFNFIKEVVKEKNYNIDLLISGPTKDNAILHKAYQNAIDILRDSNITKNIIEELGLEKYVEHVAEAIHSPLD